MWRNGFRFELRKESGAQAGHYKKRRREPPFSHPGCAGYRTACSPCRAKAERQCSVCFAGLLQEARPLIDERPRPAPFGHFHSVALCDPLNPIRIRGIGNHGKMSVLLSFRALAPTFCRSRDTCRRCRRSLGTRNDLLRHRRTWRCNHVPG